MPLFFQSLGKNLGNYEALNGRGLKDPKTQKCYFHPLVCFLTFTSFQAQSHLSATGFRPLDSGEVSQDVTYFWLSYWRDPPSFGCEICGN
jgi:hypothetical protein